MELFDIFILCGGKCGGTTLAKTFSMNGYKTTHIHSLKNKGLFKSSIDKNNIILTMDNSCINKKIYIIDSYRNPIERKISSFFQNINIYMPDYKNKSIDDLISCFNNDYINNLEEYHPLNQALNHYNIPLFNKFDFDKGYNIVEKDNKIFIKILFKDINKWNIILSEIFQKEIIIINDNLTKNKNIINIYNSFKHLYKVPNHYIYNKLLNDINFKIYNTKQEQNTYIQKWLNLSIKSNKNNKTIIIHKYSNKNKIEDFIKSALSFYSLSYRLNYKYYIDFSENILLNECFNIETIPNFIDISSLTLTLFNEKLDDIKYIFDLFEKESIIYYLKTNIFSFDSNENINIIKNIFFNNILKPNINIINNINDIYTKYKLQENNYICIYIKNKNNDMAIKYNDLIEDIIKNENINLPIIIHSDSNIIKNDLIKINNNYINYSDNINNISNIIEFYFISNANKIIILDEYNEFIHLASLIKDKKLYISSDYLYVTLFNNSNIIYYNFNNTILNICCNNLNKTYNNINDTYIFESINSNSNINIISNNNGYIVFDIEFLNKIKEIIIDNSIKQIIITNNTNIKIDIYKNTPITLIINNLKNNKIIIKNLKFYYKYNKNLFLITSKIYVSNNPFSYVNKRSIYSTKERFEQTLETIKSIKKYVNDSFIVLFDNSNFTIEEYNKLNEVTNLFINITNNSVLNNYTNESPNKAYGELSQIYYSLKYIKNIHFDNFFKISGRYLINENFNYNIYDNDSNIFKKNKKIIKDDYYYTSLYKISNKNFNSYINVINSLFEEISNNNSKYNNISLEIFFPKKILFQETNTLGLVENIAVWNEINYI
jgi:hypothetical protein